jgi:gluconokinase
MSPETAAEPGFVIIMGVAGSGKTTIAAKLAISLGWSYEDADWFHPAANIEKMHSGQPITDEDRRPWLEAIAKWIDDARRKHGHAVIACSALKRSYRRILIGDHADERLVYLKGEPALIARRMALRHNHFMPPSLLESQFAALEEPGEDEHPIVVSIEAKPQEMVERIIARLGIANSASASSPSPRRSGEAVR